MADPYDAENELVQTAAQILKAAADSFQPDPSAPESYPQEPATGKGKQLGHPGYRGVILPMQIPQGGFQSESWTWDRGWERAAVPEILYAPYEGWIKIHNHLKAGGDIMDDPVKDEAAKIAANLLGGTAFKGMSREAKALFGSGAKEAAASAAPEAVKMLPSKSAEYGTYVTKHSNSYSSTTLEDPSKPWMVTGLGVETGVDKWETVFFKSKKEAKAYHDTLKHGNEPYVIVGDKDADGLWVVKDPNLKDPPTAYFTSSKGADQFAKDGATSWGDQTLLFKNEDGDWILKGPGALGNPGVMQTANYGSDKEGAIFKLKELKEDTLVKPKALPDQTGQSDAIAKSQADYDTKWKAQQIENQEINKWGDTSVGKYIKGSIDDYDQVIVNGEMKYWANLAYKMKDTDPEMLDMIKLAHEQGIGHVMIGDNVITLNTEKAAGGKVPSRPAPKSGLLQEQAAIPTETQMTHWPDARRVDTIPFEEEYAGPLLAYHGRVSRRSGQEGPEVMDMERYKGLGVHYGTIDQANTFAGNASGQGSAARIIPTFLDLKKPLTVENFSHYDSAYSIVDALKKAGDTKGFEEGQAILTRKNSEQMDPGGSDYKATIGEMRKLLDKLGYDAVRYWNTVDDPGWSFVVWQKGKSRSATDPDHILYVAPGPSPAAMIPQPEQDNAPRSP